jgi:hypothetical protein
MAKTWRRLSAKARQQLSDERTAYLTLFNTKMSLKIVKFSNQPSVFIQSNQL